MAGKDRHDCVLRASAGLRAGLVSNKERSKEIPDDVEKH